MQKDIERKLNFFAICCYHIDVKPLFILGIKELKMIIVTYISKD